MMKSTSQQRQGSRVGGFGLPDWMSEKAKTASRVSRKKKRRHRRRRTMFEALESRELLAMDLNTVLPTLSDAVNELQISLNREAFAAPLPGVGTGLATEESPGQFLTTTADSIRGTALPSNLASIQDLVDELDSRLSGVLESGVLASTDAATGTTFFTVNLSGQTEGTVDFDFGLGEGAVVEAVLRAEDQVDVSLNWSWNLTFGLNDETGFFIDTSAIDEIDVEFTATIDDTFNIFGVMGVTPVDFKAMPGAQLTDVYNGGFEIDVFDANSKLDAAEIAALVASSDESVVISADVFGSTQMQLRAEGGVLHAYSLLDGPEVPTDLIDFTFGTNLKVEAQLLAPADIIVGEGITLKLGNDNVVDGFGDLATINFDQLETDLATILDGVLDPIIERLKELLRPLDPALDLLDLEIPVLPDILNAFDLDLPDLFGVSVEGAGGTTSSQAGRTGLKLKTLDLILFHTKANDKQKQEIKKSFKVLKAIRSFKQSETKSTSERQQVGSYSTDNKGGDAKQKTKTPTKQLQDAVKTKGAQKQNVKDVQTAFTFPVMEGDNFFRLLLGDNDVDIAQFGLKADVDFVFSKHIPLVAGVFGVSFGLGGGFEVNLDVGYDSSGIVDFLTSVRSASNNFQNITETSLTDNAELLGRGVNLDDHNTGSLPLEDGETGFDAPELRVNLTATLGPSIGVDVGIAKAVASLQGGLDLGFNFDLNDLHDGEQFVADGKIDADEIQLIEIAGLDNLFNVDFSTHAIVVLSAKIEAGLSPFIVTLLDERHTWKSAAIEALSTPVRTVDDAAIISGAASPYHFADLENGTLTLLVGDNIDNRRVPSADENEEVRIQRIQVADQDKIVLTAFGVSQSFEASQVTHISAEFGAGNDRLSIGNIGSISVYAAGGDGEDQFSYSGGADVEFIGGDGDDLLVGGAGNDRLVGGLGADLMLGGAGNDTIVVGDPKRTLTSTLGETDTPDGFVAVSRGEVAIGGAGEDTVQIVGATAVVRFLETDIEFSDTAGDEVATLGLSQVEAIDVDISVDGALSDYELEIEQLRSRLDVHFTGGEPDDPETPENDEGPLLGATVNLVGVGTDQASGGDLSAIIGNINLSSEKRTNVKLIVDASANSANQVIDLYRDRMEGLPSVVSFDRPDSFAPLGNLDLSLGGGDDQVTVHETELYDVSIEGGDGSDQVIVNLGENPINSNTFPITSTEHVESLVVEASKVIGDQSWALRAGLFSFGNERDLIAIDENVTSGSFRFGSGADDVSIEQDFASLDIRTGAGNDTVALEATGSVWIDGEAGTDTLKLKSTATGQLDSPQTGLGRFSSNNDSVDFLVEIVAVELGGASALDVHETSGELVITTSGDNGNHIRIFDASQAAHVTLRHEDDELTIFDSTSAIEVTAEATAKLTIDRGDDAVSRSNATLGSDSGKPTLSSLTGLGIGEVSFQGIGDLQILLGSGADQIEIVSAPNSLLTTIDGGSGDDLLKIKSAALASAVQLNGGDDDDTISVQLSSLDLLQLSGSAELLNVDASQIPTITSWQLINGKLTAGNPAQTILEETSLLADAIRLIGTGSDSLEIASTANTAQDWNLTDRTVVVQDGKQIVTPRSSFSMSPSSVDVQLELQNLRASAISRDGRYVYVLGRDTGGVSVFYRAIGETLQFVQRTGIANLGLEAQTTLALTPDGNYLYVAGRKSVHVFRVDSESGALSYLQSTQLESISSDVSQLVMDESSDFVFAIRDGGSAEYLLRGSDGTLAYGGLFSIGPIRGISFRPPVAGQPSQAYAVTSDEVYRLTMADSSLASTRLSVWPSFGNLSNQTTIVVGTLSRPNPQNSSETLYTDYEFSASSGGDSLEYRKYTYSSNTPRDSDTPSSLIGSVPLNGTLRNLAFHEEIVDEEYVASFAVITESSNGSRSLSMDQLVRGSAPEGSADYERLSQLLNGGKTVSLGFESLDYSKWAKTPDSKTINIQLADATTTDQANVFFLYEFQVNSDDDQNPNQFSLTQLDARGNIQDISGIIADPTQLLMWSESQNTIWFFSVAAEDAQLRSRIVDGGKDSSGETVAGINSIDGIELVDNSVALAYANDQLVKFSRNGSTLTNFSKTAISVSTNHAQPAFAGADDRVLVVLQEDQFSLFDVGPFIQDGDNPTTLGSVAIDDVVPVVSYPNREAPMAVAIAADRLYYTSVKYNALIVANKEDASEIQNVSLNGIVNLAELGSVAVSEDGQRLYLTSPGDQSLVVFQLTLDGTVSRAVAPQIIRGGSVIPNIGGAGAIAVAGNHVYVAAPADNQVLTFEQVGAQLNYLSRSSNLTNLKDPRDLVFDSTGQFLYIASFDNSTVSMFTRDAATGAITYRTGFDTDDISELRGPSSIALSNDESQMFVAAAESDSIIAFDLIDGFPRNNFLNPAVALAQGARGLEGVNALTLSPDDQYLFATGAEQNTLAVFQRNSSGDFEFAQVVRQGFGGTQGLEQPVSLLSEGNKLFIAANGNGSPTWSVFNIVSTPPDEGRHQVEFDGVTQLAISTGSGGNGIVATDVDVALLRVFGNGIEDVTVVSTRAGTESILSLRDGTDGFVLRSSDAASAVTVMGGDEADTFRVESAQGTVTMNGQSGDDLFTVFASGLPANHVLDIDGGENQDRLDFYLLPSDATPAVPGDPILASSGAGVDYENVETINPLGGAPVARISGDLTIAEGDGLSLDATGSTIPSDQTAGVAYEWFINNSSDFPDFVSDQTVLTLTWDQLRTLGVDDDGNYSVRLRVVTSENRAGSVAARLQVSDAPRSFSATPQNATTDEGTLFQLELPDSSDPGDDRIVVWRIDWGDGVVESLSGSASQAEHLYADEGDYDVTVTSVDDGGDESTWAGPTVTVLAVAPTAVVSGAASVPKNEPYELELSYAGLPEGDRFLDWIINWGDGTQETVAAGMVSANHVFTTPGQVTIEVIARDTDGHTQALPTTLSVNVENTIAAPRVFGPASISEDQSLELRFDVIGGDIPDHWEIQWGDGDSEMLAGDATSANHRFKVPNDVAETFEITVRVFDASGAVGETTLSVQVEDVAEIIITGVDLVDEGSEYSVALSLTGNQSAQRWLVDWGDGGFSGTTDANLTHTYADDGVYQIRATSDVNGRLVAGDIVKTITVVNVDPTLEILGDGTVDEGAIYEIQLVSTDAGADPVLSWDVDWGDGTSEEVSGNFVNLSHVYANGTQTYQITTVAKYDDQGPYSVTHDVDVQDVLPQLHVTGPVTVREGSLLQLDLASTDPGLDLIEQWIVSWGDGSQSVLDASGGAVGHVYTDDRALSTTVNIQAFAASQLVGETAHEVQVTNEAPTVELSASSETTVGQTFGLRIGAVTDPGADTATDAHIYWNDGTTFDGNPYQSVSLADVNSSGGVVPHDFANTPRYHEIHVSIVDEDGMHAGAGRLWLLHEASELAVPIVQGNAEVIRQALPFPEGVASYLIEWGDGETSEVSEPFNYSHTYRLDSFYQITTTALDVDGNAVSFSSEKIFIGPTGNPFHSLALPALPSDATAYRIAWGDGTSSSHADIGEVGGVITARHRYTQPGEYQVTVVELKTVGDPVLFVDQTIQVGLPTYVVDWGTGDSSDYSPTNLISIDDSTSQLDATRAYDDNGLHVVSIYLENAQGHRLLRQQTRLVVLNVAPTTVGDNYQAKLFTQMMIDDASVGVLANDTDPAGANDPLTVTHANGQLLSGGSVTILTSLGATVVMNDDGTFSYDASTSATMLGLPEGQVRDDTFEYEIRDDDGGVSSNVVTVSVTGSGESSVHLIDSPNGDDKILVVRGSSNDDKIKIESKKGQFKIEIEDQSKIKNKHDKHNKQEHLVDGEGIIRIMLFGLDGNDDIKIDSKTTIPAWLFGGRGDDKLRGGKQDDVLIGGGGRDKIDGHQGRDIVIGGLGDDDLKGGSHEDLLIAGSTVFDMDLAALEDIAAQWSSQRSFDERVANLQGVGSGAFANGGYFLNRQTVFISDDERDKIHGGGHRDWILADND